jgi:lysophospholipase L1-like esterase
MKPASTSIVRYVACGDSGAAGAGASRHTLSYAYRIADALREEREVDYKNIAVNGTKTNGFIAQQLPVVVAADPDIVVLSIGINDMFYMRPRRYVVKNLRFIFNELTKKTHADIFMASLPDMTGAKFFPRLYIWLFNWRARRFNAALKNLEGGRVHVVDIYTIDWSDVGGRRNIFARDGLHLNDIGHEKLTQAFLKNIIPT